MATAVPRYTADEVRQFPDDRLRYEVIRGELFVSPAPGTPHQFAVMELAHYLYDYLAALDLGRVITGPFEVEFTDDTAVQPDLIVVLNTTQDQLTRARHYGAPALVIEVISYSSKRTDRLQKRDLYLEEGVSEYWIVDPELRQVERWRARDERPEVLTKELTWQPMKDAPLTIDLVRVFSRSEVH